MKKVILVLTLLTLALLFIAQAYRRTTADVYQESYRADMRRQTGMSAAEVRAEEYRSRYEICDKHHNCTDVTAGSAEEAVKPFLSIPVWL